MPRVTAYCGTRNLYEDMLTAAKSLIMNSSIDKIYFIIEDDKFPYLLPDCIECINISNQTYFRPDGPNFKSIFTYMALIRAALTKVLPDEDLVLSLDVDTIIDENIDELWEIDMEKYYMAAVREPKRSTGSFLYTNFGVCLLNLKKLREDKKDDQMIRYLNNYHYDYDVQDCYNYKCQGRIYELNNKYNATPFCGKITEKKIIHFAGIRKWQDAPEITPYRQIPLTRINSIWRSKHYELSS